MVLDSDLGRGGLRIDRGLCSGVRGRGGGCGSEAEKLGQRQVDGWICWCVGSGAWCERSECTNDQASVALGACETVPRAQGSGWGGVGWGGGGRGGKGAMGRARLEGYAISPISEVYACSCTSWRRRMQSWTSICSQDPQHPTHPPIPSTTLSRTLSVAWYG